MSRFLVINSTAKGLHLETCAIIRIVLGYLEDHAAIPCRNMCKLKRLFLVTGRITLAAILERSKFCSFLVHQCKIHQTTIM
jgi:hypothetical protein